MWALLGVWGNLCHQCVPSADGCFVARSCPECDVAECDVAECTVAECDVAECDVAECGVAECDVAEYGAGLADVFGAA